MHRIHRIALYLLVVSIWLALSREISAVAVHPAQKEILDRILEELPSLASTPYAPWTNETIEAACNAPGTIFGIQACNGTGWVTEIYFSLGYFYGPLPPSIGDMEALVSFTTFGNSFSGALPASFGNLTKIQTIDIMFSNLQGPIPDTWKDMKALKTLKWEGSSNGPFVIPDWIGEEWPNLESFRFRNVGVLGPLPESFFTLPLTEIELVANQLSGAIPEGLTNISTLRKLSIQRNAFTSIPVDWSNATSLTSLSLSSNLLNNLPIILPPNLESFSGDNNPLLCAFPQSFMDHPNIKEIYIPDSQLLGDMVWASNAATSKLSQIDVSGNPDLTGTIPSDLWYYPQLISFKIAQTGIHGPLPQDVWAGTRMYLFSASDAPLGGPLPSDLDLAYMLVFFTASNCSLNGTLPEALTKLPSLNTLHLSDNELHGSVDLNWTLSTVPTEVRLSGNQFTGTVPDSLMQIPIVYLNNNQLDLCGNPSLNNTAHPPTCDVSYQEGQQAPCDCLDFWIQWAPNCLSENAVTYCNPPISPPPSNTPSVSPSPSPMGQEPTGSSTRREIGYVVQLVALLSFLFLKW